jgi:hypothetical protein
VNSETLAGRKIAISTQRLTKDRVIATKMPEPRLWAKRFPFNERE